MSPGSVVPPHACGQLSMCSGLHNHSNKSVYCVLRRWSSVPLQDHWSGSDVQDRLEREAWRLKRSGNINTVVWDHAQVAPTPCNAWPSAMSVVLCHSGPRRPWSYRRGIRGPEKLDNFSWATQPIRREARYEPCFSACKVCFHSLSLNCPCVSMGEEGGLGGWGPREKKGRLAVHFNNCSGA